MIILELLFTVFVIIGAIIILSILLPSLFLLLVGVPAIMLDKLKQNNIIQPGEKIKYEYDSKKHHGLVPCYLCGGKTGTVMYKEFDGKEVAVCYPSCN